MYAQSTVLCLREDQIKVVIKEREVLYCTDKLIEGGGRDRKTDY